MKKAEANRKADLEQMETNGKADLENLKRMMEEMLRANQDCLKEMTTCNEVTETELDPGMMQSIEEHQEVPMEDTTVMPVGQPRKRRRVCNLAAERSGEKVDPGGSRLPPAGRCPAMQKWHGTRGT
jgi:hypothetical protein